MVELTDNAALHRFEMVVDRETAFVYYTLQNDRLVLIHTEVPQSLSGRGLGAALVRRWPNASNRRRPRQRIRRR
jgi:predicted GNAT family acetyltransferase